MSISKFYSLALLAALPQFVAYEGDEGGSGDSGSGDGGDADHGAGSTGGSSQAFTQDDVNKFLAEDRRKHAAKLKAMEDKLSAAMQTSQMTQQQREELESSLEDMRKQFQTKEQAALAEKKKLESGYQTRIKELESRVEVAETRYTDSTIRRSLADAAVSGEAFNVEQIVTLLRPHTKLVDDKVVVDFNDMHVETGEPIVTQLSPSEAVKRMRELPEIHGNLFKPNVVSGMGASNGNGPSGKVDKRNLTPEQYAKLRRENPAALYGR